MVYCIVLKKQTIQMDANENIQTWVKKNMTLSLSVANRERVQQFVDAIPADLEVNNFTKLFWFLLDNKPLQTIDNTEQIEILSDTIKAKTDIIEEMQTTIDALKKEIAANKVERKKPENVEIEVPVEKKQKLFWQDNLV